MRYKGILIKWHADKAFGFIKPKAGGADIFIHKSALSNKKQTPQINDIITFSITQDKNGKYCASDAAFLGEKLIFKKKKKSRHFSIYLSFLFLIAITVAHFIGQFPPQLLFGYWCVSATTYLIYMFDKSRAQRGAWRIQENTLHLFAFIGGWPGAAIAQQLLRHKSQKIKFRKVFWLTVIINVGCLIWLLSTVDGKHMF
jgi:uncharacterized membrane protein YsdA (DUF1294 family)/cold shock CspA family protein